MQKLKKVISQLDDMTFERLSDQFNKTKAKNFLYLLNSYRSNKVDDDKIMSTLELNSNSFYVLKSRLYDKVQENINKEMDVSKEDVLNQLQHLNDLSVNVPREVAIAQLDKLEKDLLAFELHNELVILYSLLKRIHIYSEKFFHYSQLYNKHIAFALSTEKALDILGTFNRKLNQYLFSRSSNYLNEIQFLHKEIDDYYSLNPNRQIELIKNTIEVQLIIFCGLIPNKNPLELLDRSTLLIENMPDSSLFKKWALPLKFLYFEYYFKNNQLKLAETYFNEIETNFEKILLTVPISISSNYLTSRVKYLVQTGQIEKLIKAETNLMSDPFDSFSQIKIGIYRAMQHFYAGKLKEAVTILNNIINENSFKDFIHINIELKLTLVYFYIHLKEFELADNLLKNLIRKIKADHEETYSNVNNLGKVLTIAITNGGFKTINEKQKDHMTIFSARNMGDYQIIDYLIPELQNKFK